MKKRGWAFKRWLVWVIEMEPGEINEIDPNELTRGLTAPQDVIEEAARDGVAPEHVQPLSNIQVFIGRFELHKDGLPSYLVKSGTAGKRYISAVSPRKFSIEALEKCEYHCIMSKDRKRFWNRQAIEPGEYEIPYRPEQFLYVASGAVVNGIEVPARTMVDLTGAVNCKLEDGAYAVLIWG